MKFQFYMLHFMSPKLLGITFIYLFLIFYIFKRKMHPQHIHNNFTTNIR